MNLKSRGGFNRDQPDPEVVRVVQFMKWISVSPPSLSGGSTKF